MGRSGARRVPLCVESAMTSRVCIAILLALAVIGGAGAAYADHQPVIVVPGKRGVPVYVDGHEASGAIVSGDWGLYRPGHVAPTVTYRRRWPDPLGYYHYYYHWLPWYAPPGYWHAHWRVRHYRRKPVKPIRRKVIVRSGPRHYFPGGTAPPKRGRFESDAPLSPPPVPAEDFHRSWSAKSAPTPATAGQAPVVIAPVVTDRRPRRRPVPPNPAAQQPPGR
jgi:hypothetical protein